ncbi:hypothetical protein Patl1_28568 [Pistacia atlantica]|uniref:Uncharacterized protein n=1 Tax=Pistacia atlantica TaxID=434234 RepID=A0ACC1BGN5_9ROSI|nr:hypothetical protein Patl1_28568 [Pistacia atlantica]
MKHPLTSIFFATGAVVRIQFDLADPNIKDLEVFPLWEAILAKHESVVKILEQKVVQLYLLEMLVSLLVLQLSKQFGFTQGHCLSWRRFNTTE